MTRREARQTRRDSVTRLLARTSNGEQKGNSMIRKDGQRAQLAQLARAQMARLASMCVSRPEHEWLSLVKVVFWSAPETGEIY